MPLEIVTVPCLSDNYAYLLRDAATGEVGLVDAPEAAPIEAALQDRGWGLDLILITHHHADHIDGVEALRAAHGARVVGRRGRRATGCRALDVALEDGDTVALGESVAQVFEVPGHTVGHIAYYFAEAKAALHRRQPDGDGLRAAVRGHARADVGQPLDAGGAAGRDAGLFRARIRREQRPLRAVGGRARTPALRDAGRGDRGDAADGRRDGARRGSTWSGRPTRSCARRTPAFKARLGLENLPDAQVFAEVRRRKDAF